MSWKIFLSVFPCCYWEVYCHPFCFSFVGDPFSLAIFKIFGILWNHTKMCLGVLFLFCLICVGLSVAVDSWLWLYFITSNIVSLLLLLLFSTLFNLYVILLISQCLCAVLQIISSALFYSLSILFSAISNLMFNPPICYSYRDYNFSFLKWIPFLISRSLLIVSSTHIF